MSKRSISFWYSFRLAALANADDATARAAFETFAESWHRLHPEARLPARVTATEIAAARDLARRVLAAVRRWKSREVGPLVHAINQSLPRRRRTRIDYVLQLDGSLGKMESMAGRWTWSQAVALAATWLIEDAVHEGRPVPRQRLRSLRCAECGQAFMQPGTLGRPAVSCSECRRTRHLRKMRVAVARLRSRRR